MTNVPHEDGAGPAAITISYADDVPSELVTVEDIQRALAERFPDHGIYIEDGYVYVGKPDRSSITR